MVAIFGISFTTIKKWKSGVNNIRNRLKRCQCVLWRRQRNIKVRLWHKDLIPYLPRKQLIAQWRECCAICSNWAKKGTPNHILVNKVTKYPTIQFFIYSETICCEMVNRGYEVSQKSKDNFQRNFDKFKDKHNYIEDACFIFSDWHNERYLKQCLFNLQEKYDCGGISEKEWCRIAERFSEYL